MLHKLKEHKWATIGFIVLAIFIVGLITSEDKIETESLANIELLPDSTEIYKHDLIIGKADAPATIIEYGDFKCPSCAQFHQTTGKQLRDEYVDTGALKIVFRGLDVIGPDSGRSARGAYCADDQGLFVAFHDAVYDLMWSDYYQNGNYSSEYSNVLTTDKLTQIAGGVGIAEPQFKECLDSGEYASSLATNMRLSREDGVRGTPTFKANGQIVTGPRTFSVFKTLIELQL